MDHARAVGATSVAAAVLGGAWALAVACTPTTTLGRDGGLADAEGFDAAATDTGAARYAWFTTCGDAVCGGLDGGHRDHGLSSCTNETAGAPCSTPNQACDPQDPCNVLLVCTDVDPKTQPPPCPR